jgi:hypothetical protein
MTMTSNAYLAVSALVASALITLTACGQHSPQKQPSQGEPLIQPYSAEIKLLNKDGTQAGPYAKAVFLRSKKFPSHYTAYLCLSAAAVWTSECSVATRTENVHILSATDPNGTVHPVNLSDYKSSLQSVKNYRLILEIE